MTLTIVLILVLLILVVIAQIAAVQHIENRFNLLRQELASVLQEQFNFNGVVEKELTKLDEHYKVMSGSLFTFLSKSDPFPLTRLPDGSILPTEREVRPSLNVENKEA